MRTLFLDRSIIKALTSILYINSRKGERMNINAESNNETLVKAFQEAPSLADRNEILGILYTKNIDLFRKIASRYSAYESMEDLIQEGFFGLKTAAELYDQEQEASFATYAFQWIRQAMRRYLDNCGSCLRIPSDRKDTLIRYSKLCDRFMMKFDRLPSDLELMRILDVNEKQLERLKYDRACLKIRSLDKPLKGVDDESITLGDTVEAEKDEIRDFIEIKDNEKLAFILWDEVDLLEPQQAEIIRKRYQGNATLEEVGKAMNLSPGKIRCIQAKAMRQLRKSKRIRLYADEYIASAYHCTGLSSFRNTGTSSTERTAIKAYEKQIDNIDREIRRIENKYDVILDDGYKQIKVNQILKESEVRRKGSTGGITKY